MAGRGVLILAVGAALAARAVTDAPPVASRAVIRGTVSYAGAATPGAALDLSIDPYCAEARETPLHDTPVRTSPAGGLRDVLVVVRHAPEAAEVAPAVLDQIGCEYVPRVLGLTAGQTLIVRNSDRTLHNVHVTASRNRGFNLGQPLPGIEARRSFEAAESGIDVKCDIHGWMHGTIHVLDHPYHAVTDADGRFAIPDLPPGTYTIEFTHGILGTRSQTVTLDAGGATIEVTY